MSSYLKARCEDCPLLGRPLVQGNGPYEKYLVIGEAPGYTEVKDGIPFVGESGRLLRQTLGACGISPDDVWFTNAVSCHPPENATPGVDEILACRGRLIDEIKRVNPKKILTVGAIALSSITRTFPIPSITKARSIGRMISVGEQKHYLMPTFHPAAVLRQVDLFRDFAEDIVKWRELDSPIPPPKVMKWVSESSFDVSEQLKFLEKASALSCDLETTGLDFVNEEIESVGFGALITHGDFDIAGVILRAEDIYPVRNLLYQFLTTFKGEIAFHNIKFDLQFLWKLFGKVPELKQPQDTMLLHYALDERAEGRYQVHGLKHLSRRYDIADYHWNFKKFYSLPREERPYDELFDYQCLDLYVTIKLLHDLSEDILAEDPQLMMLVVDHLIPAQLAYTKMEIRGTKIDKEHLKALREELLEDLGNLLSTLQEAAEPLGMYQEEIPFDILNDKLKLLVAYPKPEEVTGAYVELELREYYVRTGYYKTRRMVTRVENEIRGLAESVGLYQAGQDFNPNSSHHVKKFVAELGLDTPSTQREDLWLAMAHQNITMETRPKLRTTIDSLIDYRMKTKILSTYVDGLLSSLDVNDRVHMDYIIPGSGTGRPACKEPNVQNIPQVMGPAIRNAFIVDTDWIFGTADYSQLELRIVMHLAQDKVGIQAYREGRDIHREVASAMFRKPSEEITFFERYLAKYVDFGLIYGRGIKSLIEGWEMEYLVQMGGKRWTYQEAKHFVDVFLGEFEGVNQFIETQQRKVLKQGYIKTLMGRRRRFPFIPSNRKQIGYIQRQAVNSPIQSLASDLNMSAMYRILRRFERELPGWAYVLYTVYDSIEFEFHRSVLTETLTIVREEMEKPPIKLDVPIQVDIEIGKRWGETKPYEQYSEEELELLYEPSNRLVVGTSEQRSSSREGIHSAMSSS